MRSTTTLCHLALLALPLPALAAPQCPVQLLEASDLKSGDEFSKAIAVSGDTMVVGKPHRDGTGFGGYDGDAAYVFERTQAGWVEVQTLSAGNASAGEWFGDAVAIAGDTILVADPGAPAAGGVAFAGRVYIFERGSSGVWSQVASLFANNPTSSAAFGTSLDLSADGQRAVVGAVQAGNGRSYVFDKVGGSWSQTASFTPNTGTSPGGYGVSIDLEGDRYVVGDWFSSAKGPASGSAYVYVEQGGSWSLEQRIDAADGAAGDNFGIDGSMDGDRLLVGACGDDGTTGSAYLLERVGSSWVERQKVSSEVTSPAELFGIAVHLEDELALIGEVPPFQTGLLTVFDVAGASLSLRQTVAPAGASSDAFFGIGLDVQDGELFVGARQDKAASGFTHGAVRTFATQGLVMLASADSLSVSAGGQVSYQLVSCPSEPGDTFLMVGSLSGTTPGTPVSNLTLPLVLDSYMLFSLTSANTAPYVLSAAPLNSGGQGTAIFAIPAGAPAALVGVQIHHATALIELLPTLLHVVQVSEALTLDFTP